MSTLNTDILKGNWKQIKGDIKKTWSEFTEDEINRLEGEYDNLVGSIQEKYGMKIEEARDKVNNFLAEYRTETNDKPQ